MNRYKEYQSKVTQKLLLSKYVYETRHKVARISRLVLGIKPNASNPEVAFLTTNTVFTQKPGFARAKSRRGRAYRLTQMHLTSHFPQLLVNLHTLMNVLIPYQFEHKNYFVKFAHDTSINWTFENCMPPTHLDLFFAYFIILDSTFDISVNIKSTFSTIAEVIFLLRLFEVPIDTRLTDL